MTPYFKIFLLLSILVPATFGGDLVQLFGPEGDLNRTCGRNDVYTASSEDYIFTLFPLVPNITIWDGPRSLSEAPTTMAMTSWTEEELKYYNYFAAAMYCTYTLQNLTCCPCAHFVESVTSVKFIENTVYSTLAMITMHENKAEIVVTFRGSRAWLNWAMDFFPLPLSITSTIKIHRGIHLATMSLYNEVTLELMKLLEEYPNYRVVFTGHSLGASMASLFIFFMHYRNQFPGTRYGLATYGQLRQGNKGYADYMNALPIPMGRVVSRLDIAPHGIPVSLFGPIAAANGLYYVHHGQEVWINGHNTTFCSKTVYEDFSCSNSLGPGYTFWDHLQYLDVDYTGCYTSQGYGNIDFFSLPIGFTPTNYIPPLPTKLYNILFPIFQGGYQGLLPFW